MGTTASALVPYEKLFWDVVSGSPTAYWNGEENPSFVFPLATPPFYRDLMEENGVDITQAFFLTSEGISHEAQHKVINVRAVHRLLSIDIKSVQLVAVSERQWKLLFSYTSPILPCEIIISFYAKFSPYAKQLKIDSATFSSDPIFIPARDKTPANNNNNNNNKMSYDKEKQMCIRFDSKTYNMTVSASALPSLKHCTKYPSDHVFDVSILVRPASTKAPSSAHAPPSGIDGHVDGKSSGLPSASALSSLGKHQVHPAPSAATATRPAETTSKATASAPGIKGKGTNSILPVELLSIPSLFVPANVTPEWSPDRYVWQEMYTFRIDPSSVRPFAIKFVEEERARAKAASQLKKEQRRMDKLLAQNGGVMPIMLAPGGLMKPTATNATIAQRAQLNAANGGVPPNFPISMTPAAVNADGALTPAAGDTDAVQAFSASTPSMEPPLQPGMPLSHQQMQLQMHMQEQQAAVVLEQQARSKKHKKSHNNKTQQHSPSQDGEGGGYQLIPNVDAVEEAGPSTAANLPYNMVPIGLQATLPQQQMIANSNANALQLQLQHQQVLLAQQQLQMQRQQQAHQPTIYSHPARLFPVLPLILQFQKVDVSETVYTVMDVYGQRRRMATLPLVKEITVLEDNHWVPVKDTTATTNATVNNSKEREFSKPKQAGASSESTAVASNTAAVADLAGATPLAGDKDKNKADNDAAVAADTLIVSDVIDDDDVNHTADQHKHKKPSANANHKNSSKNQQQQQQSKKSKKRSKHQRKHGLIPSDSDEDDSDSDSDANKDKDDDSSLSSWDNDNPHGVSGHHKNKVKKLANNSTTSTSTAANKNSTANTAATTANNNGSNGNTDKEADDGDTQCIVCLSETREVILFPCRHLNTCLPCAKLLIASRNQCPICRSTAEAIVHIVAFHTETKDDT